MRASRSPGSRTPYFVFVFVIGALMLLSTVPYWTFRNIEVLRREGDYGIEPARNLAARYELALARGETDDAAGILARLESIARRLGPRTARRVNDLATASSHGISDSVVIASTRLQQELRAAARANRRDVMNAQNRAIAWSVALFMLTLFSMLAVGWLLWRQRLLLEQVNWAHRQSARGARDEQALRAAAAAVAAPLTTEEVVRQIARGAVQATNADGAFAAHLEPDGILCIIAVAGDTGISVNTELPDKDSVIARILHTGVATVVDDLHFNSHAGQAVVVPMVEAEGAVGALVLVWKTVLDETTLPLLLARASTFGDLAAIALRKARLLEESEDRRRKLEAVERSRARLLRGFSHDIKNPLSNTDGFLQLLQLGLRGQLSHEQLETVQRARTSLSAGLRMLRDLVDFAVASVGRISLTVMQTSIADVLLEVVESHRVAAEQKEIALRLEQGDCPELRTDGDRVRQVLDNLLSNAVKYTPRGGRITVKVGVVDRRFESERGRWMKIDVVDNGMGIPPEFQEKVFREFTRLQADQEPGAGIGLAISQSLAMALGGKVTLMSKVGAGSTFTFWLPLSSHVEEGSLAAD
jgi:signal transduction histidine kinase